MPPHNGHSKPYTPAFAASSASHFLQRDPQIGFEVSDDDARNNFLTSGAPRQAYSMPMAESGSGALGHTTFQTPDEPFIDHSQWQPEEFGVLASFDFYDGVPR
jgi:hypothetical protein